MPWQTDGPGRSSGRGRSHGRGRVVGARARARVVLAGVLLIAAGSAWGQCGGGGTTDAAAPLSGPRVHREPTTPRPTIVSRGLHGDIAELDTTAAEAALEKLTLDPATREKVDRVLGRRAKLVDEFVAENLDYLLKLQTAASTQDGWDLVLLGFEGLRKTRPIREAGQLEKSLAAVLPPAQREVYEGMLEEYWDAVITQARAKPKPDGSKVGRVEAILDVRLGAFGKEVERSFARLMESGELLYRMVFRGVTLPAEKEAAVRGIVSDWSRRTGNNPSEEDKAALFVSIVPHLDNAQRDAVIENVRLLAGGMSRSRGNAPEARAEPSPAAGGPEGGRP